MLPGRREPHRVLEPGPGQEPESRALVREPGPAQALQVQAWEPGREQGPPPGSLGQELERERGPESLALPGLGPEQAQGPALEPELQEQAR